MRSLVVDVVRHERNVFSPVYASVCLHLQIVYEFQFGYLNDNLAESHERCNWIPTLIMTNKGPNK